MGEASRTKGILGMEKKNRFSMLEIKGGDKKSPGIGNSAKSIPPHTKEEFKRPKDFKVVIEKDEFSKNLERHHLTEKVTTIEKQKVDIALDVSEIKKRAWAQIAIGVVIIIFSLKRFFIRHDVSKTTYMDGEEDVTVYSGTISEMTPFNYVIFVLLALLFSYLYFSGKKKKEKK